MILSLEEIKKLIPHRYPFLLIDNCKIIKAGEKGIGYRKFLPDEYFFKGHFPNNPIVPGVIMIEALAQTAGAIVSHNLNLNREKTVLFMSISNAKFRKPVYPNDEISFEVSLSNRIKSAYKFYGEAKRFEEKVCEAFFTAMIIE